MDVQVINPRKGPFGSVLGYFDVVLNNAIRLNGLAMKQKNDGSAYYFQPPAKARVKNGEPVIDDKGFQKYDAYFDFVLEQGAKGWFPTEEAAELKAAILAAGVEALELKAAGRGTKDKPAAAKGKAKAAAVATKTDDADDEDFGDDDLPF